MTFPMDEYFLKQAIQLAFEAMELPKGGPFGAVVVYEGEIIGASSNNVFTSFDPTAHAEVQAIRDACGKHKIHFLKGCTLYSSCEPCPMCFSAIFYAKIDRVVYAASHKDADDIAGFGVDRLYAELERPVEQRKLNHVQLLRQEGLGAFERWANSMPDKEQFTRTIQQKK
ncbi:MAG: nucleoside deaminase [Bacteroidota bacterium]